MSMNIFRLAGDMSHVFSILVLLLRLRVAKNAQGVFVDSYYPAKEWFKICFTHLTLLDIFLVSCQAFR
jgi:hypothetical protein